MRFSIKYLFLLALPYVFVLNSYAQNQNNFREIRLSLLPSAAQSKTNTYSLDNNYYQLGASISYFFLPFLALNTPYSYSKHDDITIHRAGLGPQVSFNFLKNLFHFDLQSAFQYTNFAKDDKFGLHLGGSIGLKLDRKKTFSIGPFYNFHQTFLSGEDYKVHSYGLALHFRNYSDAHMY
ncbi:MAG TPA: hypothetical protein PKC21_00870 [Oligoflexia bacterium]|nr:hypothetical protein [Oligoflexia bacterium]HMR23881.1 hypothetical protein [Oligoflexia bacterium]